MTRLGAQRAGIALQAALGLVACSNTDAASSPGASVSAKRPPVGAPAGSTLTTNQPVETQARHPNLEGLPQWSLSDEQRVVSRVTAEDKAAASAAFKEAKGYLLAERFAKALPLFVEAYRRYPRPLPKYNIAVCLDGLGQRSNAVAGYRWFIDAVVAAPKPSVWEKQYRKEAEQRIRELEQSP